MPRLCPVKHRFFADDCILYRQIRNQHDCAIFQEDFNKLAAREKKWGMAFHPDRHSTLRISRSRKPVTANYIPLKTAKGHTVHSADTQRKDQKNRNNLVQTVKMSGKHPYPTAPPAPAGYQPPPQGYPQQPYPSSSYPYQQPQAVPYGSSPYGAVGGPPPYAGGPPQGPPPPYSQYPTQYPQGPPQQPMYPQQPQMVVAQGAFDSGARFDGVAGPRIPPPPPGMAPNAAQIAAMQGHTVVGTQQKADWFSGGKGGGFTFW